MDEQNPEPWYRRGLRGACAGCVATGAMSLVQFTGARSGRRHPPPIEITRRLHVPVPGRTPRGPSLYRRGIALHVLFGTLCGALYGIVAPSKLREATATAYAALLYGAAYRGLLTALGLHPHPARDDARRQATNAVAHLVYGITLAEVMRATDPAPSEPQLDVA